jgi:hypothetical protein
MKPECRKRDDYSRLLNAGKLHGTITRAVRLRSKRNALAIATPQQDRLTRIELPGWLAGRVSRLARDEYPRRQNWNNPIPHNDHQRKGVCVLTQDEGRYSSRCTYTHYTYTPTVRCCGACSPGRLLWLCHAGSKILKAPKGWRFGRDDLGLYVVRNGEPRSEYRYHFVGDDLENTTTLRAAGIEHEQRQKRAAQEQKARERSAKQLEKLREKALRVGVYVRAADSIRAGNCGAGTRQWAEDHSLAVNRAYPVEAIARFAVNGHKQQVERAIEAAIDRSVIDLQRGYCDV